MTDQGSPTPPHGVPAVDDPTQAVPPPGGGQAGGASVFGSGTEGADPTVVVAPVPAPGGGTPPPGAPGDPGDPGGPGGPNGDGEGGDDRPWYAHPAAITAAVLLGLGALGVLLVLALGGDDDAPTRTPTSSTTTSSTSTTIATTESRCRAGDQAACNEFSTEQLEALCNEGVAAACQVLLSRGTVPEQTAPVPAPSDVELCRQGDVPACGRLSDGDVIAICDEGVQAACDEEARRFGDPQYEGYLQDCRDGISSGCEELTTDDLVTVCNEGVTAACVELRARIGE